MTEDEFKNSIFIKDYIDQQVASYKLQYPQAKENDLRLIISGIVKNRLIDRKAQIYNDYQDDMTIDTSLLGIYNYCKTSKPITAGNGTFFLNQDKASSPVADIIIGKIANRKAAQHKRDEFLATPYCYEYRYFEMIQMEIKVTINAIYGSFGTPTFQLYNMFTAAATTGTAQSLISTTAMAFESFLVDNVIFKTFDECAAYIKNIINEPTKTSVNYFEPHNSNQEIFDRLKKVFKTYWKPEYEIPLMKIIMNLTPEQKTRIYYKNNLIEFVANGPVTQLLIDIYNDSKHAVNENDNENGVFKNANNPPKSIQKHLDSLWELLKEFVFYNHPYVERIKRLKYDTRRTVALEDTDSNVITIAVWTEYLESNIIPKSNCEFSDENKKYVTVNIIAYCITQLLKELLAYYCESCNILPQMAKRINMKNELYIPKLLLAKVKKRYIALWKLREGNELNPPKPDIKGHDFKKAGTSPEVEAVMRTIIKECIISPKVEPIDVSRINSMLHQFEITMMESLKKGERQYLPRKNCKPPIAYKEEKRMSQPAVLATILWDTLYPDKALLLPDKLDLVYLDIPTLATLEPLKVTYPEMYEKFDRYIFNGPIKQFKNNGVNYLALPNGTESIPEWIIPYIDIDRIVSKNINTFKPVTEALTFHTLKTSTETEFFSNIIEI